MSRGFEVVRGGNLAGVGERKGEGEAGEDRQGRRVAHNAPHPLLERYGLCLRAYNSLPLTLLNTFNNSLYYSVFHSSLSLDKLHNSSRCRLNNKLRQDHISKRD